MPGIYPVLSSLEQLNAVVTTGISTVQLRLKDLPAPELRQQISAAIALGRQHQLQLFINDHWQLALELGAYGVHLGRKIYKALTWPQLPSLVYGSASRRMVIWNSGRRCNCGHLMLRLATCLPRQPSKCHHCRKA